MSDTIIFYPGYRWEPTPKNWEELTEEECLEILGRYESADVQRERDEEAEQEKKNG